MTAGKRERLKQLVQAAKERFDALSPEEQAAHREAQRQSWVRGELAMGREPPPAAPEAPALEPAEWKMVPVEPTPEMQIAGVAQYYEGGCSGVSGDEKTEIVQDIYRAMLDAAPEAPALEPAAFQWREDASDTWWHGRLGEGERGGLRGYEERPLYPHPAPAFTVGELAHEIRRLDGNHSLGAGLLAEALMPFLSRNSAAPAPVVRVKPLVWEKHHLRGKRAHAAGLGVYRIHESGKFWYLNQDYMGEGGEEAAQADCERRILSTLDITSAPSPDAISAAREEGRREGYEKGVKAVAEFIRTQRDEVPAHGWEFVPAILSLLKEEGR